MSRAIIHFPLSKLKRLSKKRMSALQAELKQLIKKDPMMRAVVAANRQMSKVIKAKVSKKFREVR
jgi:hypothetical protein